MNEVKDSVDKILKRHFTVGECPETVYQEFVAFCKAEYANNWAAGLKILMERHKVGGLHELLAKDIQELFDRVEVLETKPEVKSEPEKKKRATFGSKNDEGEGK